MGVRLSTAVSTVINNAATLAAETILFTTGPIIPAQDSAPIFIFWYFTLTIGATGNSVTVRIRKGTLITGALVNTPAAITVVAGNVVLFSGSVGDTANVQGTIQYSLTAQVGAATANSAVGEASLFCMTL